MVLRSKMPSINDQEGSKVPAGLPSVIDAHVHIFPRSIFSAIWKWFDETSAYRNLIEKYDNLWLDTAMVLTDYFPMEKEIDLSHYRSDRIMYGSDFPNIPHAWDRELKELKAACISYNEIDKISSKNAIDFFNFKSDQISFNYLDK